MCCEDFELKCFGFPAVITWTGAVSGWTHIAVVYNNLTPSLYVNGQLVATGSATGNSLVSPTDMIFGGYYGNMQGMVDEIRVWSYARSQQQVQAYLHQYVDPLIDGLSAYWQINASDGNTVKDLSGNGHDKQVPAGYSSTSPGATYTSNAPAVSGGANYVSDAYDYGFNGKLKDNSIEGSSGVDYDYGARIYDARLGRFLTNDPLTKKFPWYTPYQFAGNKPIACVDLDGLEELIATTTVQYRVNYKCKGCSEAKGYYYNESYSSYIYTSQLTNPTDARIKIAMISFRAGSDIDDDGTGTISRGTNQSQTSFAVKYGKELKSGTINYLVIPRSNTTAGKALVDQGVSMGDLYVAVRYDKNGKALNTTVGLVGDGGHPEQPGEQSRDANENSNQAKGVDANQYSYYVFAGTAKYWEEIVGKDKKGRIKSIPTNDQLSQAYDKFRAEYFPPLNSNTIEYMKANKNLRNQPYIEFYDNATDPQRDSAIAALKAADTTTAVKKGKKKK